MKTIEVVAVANVLGFKNASVIAEKIGRSPGTIAQYQRSLKKSGGDADLARASINAVSNRWQRKNYHADPAYRRRRCDQSRACRLRKKAA